MTGVYSFSAGSAPLLISIPHDGRALLPGQEKTMSAAARRLPDTDWHVRQLYAFAAELGANVLAANYSRYVIDLNRPANDAALYDGQVSTGLCPAKTFAGEHIYESGDAVPARERAARVKSCWQPYHARIEVELERLRDTHGYALLWDAHSIAAEVPALFEGVLPDLNIGTNDNRSCPAHVADAVLQVVRSSPYSAVLNGRFRGGYITRHYGNPAAGIFAMQLELAQRTYMDEKNLRYDAGRASALADTIAAMLVAFGTAAKERP